jgi:hypothetical protein
MKNLRAHILIFSAFCFLAHPQDLRAQASIASRTAREVVEAILKNGTSQGAKELAEIGGENAVKEVLETSFREGGDALVVKVAATTKTYGSAILLGSKKSPARFIQAFDEVPADLKASALQALTREPELVAGLTAQFGRDALIAVAKQPGIAAPFIKTFGAEGAQTLGKLTTDQSIQLVRMSGPLSKIPPGPRNELLAMIGRAPEKILDLLEKHPKVLYTSAGLGAFLASKDLLIGKDDVVVTPDGQVVVVTKPGVIGRFLEKQQAPASTILYIVGAGVLGWFAIKLWGVWRKERAKHP